MVGVCAEGWSSYIAGMEDGTIFGLSPIVVGWLGAIAVLALIRWLRGK
jgi:hypothetical protein